MKKGAGGEKEDIFSFAICRIVRRSVFEKREEERQLNEATS